MNRCIKKTRRDIGIHTIVKVVKTSKILSKPMRHSDEDEK